MNRLRCGFIISGQVQVEGHIFPCPFDVMADQNMDILFGLNMLRRHRCSIDLNKNVLRFGDGTEAPFINEVCVASRDPQSGVPVF